jgi:CheY-like chemotaxis protein
VTALGGEITLDSRVGQGTTVRVLLQPAAALAPSRPDTLPPAGITGARGRILVIDDEPIICATIKRALRAHDVTVTTRAEDAVKLVLSGERFDLILCDVMMPQVSGMDVHERLAAGAADQADRIVFLTGGAFTPRAREFLAGMSGRILDKPFDITQLKRFVGDWVSRVQTSA